MARERTTVSVPIPTDLFLELTDFLREVEAETDPVDAVSNAIEYWLWNADEKREDFFPSEPAGYGSRGLLWRSERGSVFLPDGSEVRMKYRGTYHYARVRSDDLLYEGTSVSPSGFANRVTNSSRNAWRDLEIKRPEDAAWIPAADLRQTRNAAL